MLPVLVLSFGNYLFNLPFNATILLLLFTQITNALAGAGAITFGLPGKISDAKVILNGGKRITFLRPDGYFSLYPLLQL